MAQTVMKRGPVSGTAIERAARKRKPFLIDLYGTAVGKKYVMAITGIGLLGFVLFHMIGNLKMYMGQSDLNHYAHFLEKLLYPILPEKAMLWILRGGLLTMAVLHIHAAHSLTVLNKQARPVKYQSERDYQVASFASRTMRYTGIIVLLFLIWHLLDLTFGAGAINEYVGTKDSEGLKDVYGAVAFSLSEFPWPSFTSWPILPSVRTCSTVCGACFNHLVGITRDLINGDVPSRHLLRRSSSLAMFRSPLQFLPALSADRYTRNY